MQNMQQQQGEGMFGKAKQSFDIIYFFMLGHAMCLLPFLRVRFGVEALSWSVVAAFIVQAIFFLIAPSQDMLNFFLVWAVFVINRRFMAWRRWRGGHVEHSQYRGFPWLAMKVPFVTWERTAKALIEPALCLLVGALILPYSPSLGAFILLGVVSLTVVLGIESEINHRRVRRMHDAQLEQRGMSQRFRDGKLW
jgi:hypothetical protein